MRLETRSFNKKNEAVAYINAAGIQKENLISFFQEKDSTYTILYYAED